MSNKELLQEELLALLEAKVSEARYNRISTLFPDSGPFRRELYPKHIQFMNAGAKYSERGFIAANRTGKTVCGAYEMACHLTGQYPEWWNGRRFINPISAWAVGVSNQATKEIQQFELIGDINDIGTGTIPKNCIAKITKKPGVADAIETVYVKHTSGGMSQCTFKSYEQGRESFQGTKKQVIWLDEEPKDKNIYSECLTRTMDKYNPGIIYCTFTPLFGLSDVVLDFLPDGKHPENGVNPKKPQKFVTQVSWEEVPHLDEAQKQAILASYSSHERAARSKGVPSLGAGAIYPYIEEEISCAPFAIPPWWPRAYGLDVGWNRTAAVWGALDPDSNVVYLYSEHYQGEAHPAVHASAIKARGDWISGAIDPASQGVSQADGKALINLYLNEGLNLSIANNSTESGLIKISQMLASGQLKVFSTLTNWFGEFRTYRRDENGKIVKKNDHLMDATRYFAMTGMEMLSTNPDNDDFNDDKGVVSGNGRNEITGY